MFVNFAHRGASEYAPENTMLAFYLGMYMGANGIETDVQLTKDGICVLFHDGNMQRMCDTNGAISDYTLEELRAFNVTKNGLSDKIVTLDDFLAHFAFRDITFAIELKSRGSAKPAADIIRRYGICEKVTVTSFNFDELSDMRSYAPEFRCGYLTDKIDGDLLTKMKALGIGEICPVATMCEKDFVSALHARGFNVRAWGVSNEELMRKVYDAGCDGMTVNFPDKLTEYIKADK